MKRLLPEVIALKADIGQGLTDVAEGRLQDFDAHRIVEKGRKLCAERRLASLDAAIERGIADVEAGRLHEADEVFAELELRIAALPNDPPG